MSIVNERDTIQDWATLAAYISSGGVTDPEGQMVGHVRTAAAVMDALMSEGLPLRMQANRYIENPIAIVILLKRLGMLH